MWYLVTRIGYYVWFFFSFSVQTTATFEEVSDDGSSVAIVYGIVVGVVFVIVMALIIVVALFYFHYRLKVKHDYSLQPALLHPPGSTFSSNSLNSMKLVKQVGRGRFATVWKASMNNATIAVKSFSVFSIESWNHEKDIYTTPLFQHDCLLQFLGADQKTVGYETEYWIITAYHEHGCLLDFLRVQTINLENLCVMAESIAMGLAHLHSTFTRNGVYKPAIVHRDFKSKNVLVKEDLSCVISDFGMAIKFMTGESPAGAQGQVSHFIYNTHIHTHTHTNTQTHAHTQKYTCTYTSAQQY